MKQIRLSLTDYLDKLQELEDKGIRFEVSDNVRTLTIGVYVEDLDTRFCFPTSAVRVRLEGKHKIDESLYHGKTLKLVKGFNKTIEEFVPFANFPKIHAEMQKIAVRLKEERLKA